MQRQNARNRCGVVIGALVPELVCQQCVKAPVGNRLFARFDSRPGVVGKGQQRNAGNGRQAFLSAGDDCVDLPLIHVERHGAQGANRIDNHCAVIGMRQSRNRFQMAVINGIRGLTLNNGQRAEITLLQVLLNDIGVGRLIVRDLHDGDRTADTGCHLRHTTAEVTVANRQHLAARRHQVADRHFHCR